MSASGSVRDTDEGKIKWHLIPAELWLFPCDLDSRIERGVYKFLCEGSREGDVVNKHALDGLVLELIAEFHEFRQALANRYEGGAIKYAAFNWCKGQPVTRLLDSLGRHLAALYDEDESEDHEGAVLWNIAAIEWTIRYKPELNDWKGWSNL